MARSVWSPATIPVALAVLVCMKRYRDILDAFLTAVSGMQDKLKMAKPLWSLAAISAAFAVSVCKNVGVAVGNHKHHVPDSLNWRADGRTLMYRVTGSQACRRSCGWQSVCGAWLPSHWRLQCLSTRMREWQLGTRTIMYQCSTTCKYPTCCSSQLAA